MELSGNSLLITGGAGFVGSHLAEHLRATNDVRVVDDLSNGHPTWVPDDVPLIEGDLTDPDVVADAITPDLDMVFHFAARKNVNDPNPRAQFEANLAMTYNILERMDAVGVSNLAFASSSTVYGEAPMPTPETHPGIPISIYGAAKTADESLCSVYGESHGFTVWIYRFANVIGPRLQPGSVIVDFIEKLQTNPETLEILGDGRQEKSYIHVTDCVDAMYHVITHTDAPVNRFNLGTTTTISVTEIADIVADELGMDPAYSYTGGDRGWVGDVPKMRLSIEKLQNTGWTPTQTSAEAVTQAVRELVDERVSA